MKIAVKNFDNQAGARDRPPGRGLRLSLQGAPDPRGRAGLPAPGCAAARTRSRPAPRSPAPARSSWRQKGTGRARVERHPQPQVARRRHGARPGPAQPRQGPDPAREEERAEVGAVAQAGRSGDRRRRQPRARQPQDPASCWRASAGSASPARALLVDSRDNEKLTLAARNVRR